MQKMSDGVPAFLLANAKTPYRAHELHIPEGIDLIRVLTSAIGGS
jgi:hypothetical protein